MKGLAQKILLGALCVCLLAELPGKMVFAAPEEVSTEDIDSNSEVSEPEASNSASEDDKKRAKDDLANYLKECQGDVPNKAMQDIVQAAFERINQEEWVLDELREFVEDQKRLIDAFKGDSESNEDNVNSENSGNNSGNEGISDNNVVPAGHKITDSDRGRADEELKNHMDSLKVRYNLDSYYVKLLEKSFYSAVYYIANTEMTESELWAYVSRAKADMDAIAGKTNETATTATSEFLQLGDNWQTPKVAYGRQVAIVVPIINLGTEGLTNLIVQPEVSNDVSKWPFEPDSTGYVQTIPEIPGNSSYASAMETRREVTYYFTAREDVLSGYYPLTFDVYYTKAGIRSEEPVKLTLFVETEGAPGSGTIGMNPAENSAKPRIVVTGFETNPAEVYAGSNFTVTIHVKNTSPSTAVSNVLFDLQAVESGSEANTTYAVFLPTSGSNSIYVPKLAPGAAYDLSIEMSAKADLTQKPYVITVNMKYDAGSATDISDTASVSIPVKQEAKFDTSTPEVMPNSISVGDQTNIMFSIYNTGKTNLYNVKVNYEGDSVSGGDVFLGNIKPGETGNVDSMVSGVAATMDEGKIKAVISYEDEAGNVSTKEVEMELFVNEMVMDDIDPGMMDPGMMEEESHTGRNVGIIVTIAAVIAAAAAVVILKLRKKKKALSLLAEDLSLLEDEKDSDSED